MRASYSLACAVPANEKFLSCLDGVFQLRNPFSENPFGKNCVLALLPSSATFSFGNDYDIRLKIDFKRSGMGKPASASI